MPYILQGTKGILNYWNILGRPCEVRRLAHAVKSPVINFAGVGRDKQSLTISYGETEAQNLAAALGTTVNNVSLSGDQVLI